jgi:uncharacterized protein (DUF362 family)
MAMRFEKLNVFLHGYDEVEIPKMIKIRQKFNATKLSDPEAEIRAKLKSQMASGHVREIKGKRIGITAGSRGIPKYKEIMRALVSELKQYGADPFIFPAMGSHAGGTAESQKEMLILYGITEEYVGAPILSSMDSVPIGTLPNNQKIYCDKYAAEADGIVLFHKIKPHPNFKGEHESGLLKMICIGAGKHYGAAAFHEGGFDNFDKRMVEVSEFFLSKVNVVFGVGICENAYDELARIEIIPTEQIIAQDAELLEYARKEMPKLYPGNIDVLVIDEIGKEISGAGFDANIHGRNVESEQSAEMFKQMAPAIKRIVLLDITEQTHGCASTMGCADFISYRFVNKIDFESTYINLLTSKISIGAAMPPYGNSDENAIKFGILTGVGTSRKNARVVRIKNTLCLSEIEVSIAYIEELKNSPEIEIISEPYEWVFNEHRDLW